MLPLKTLIVAAIIAIAFSPHVNASAAHDHLETAAALAATQAQVIEP